ncbi:hypothetical protein CKO31_23565 [Thiohalocapsa halophila]|uniref:Uncharacterized protein n=1 Tax=Thiohalocapsa halophila TaxID=69359 RepID=A0ABS1CP13_9GAMM|nr:hypothetical protein [Thiohalocapsa halophila]
MKHPARVYVMIDQSTPIAGEVAGLGCGVVSDDAIGALRGSALVGVHPELGVGGGAVPGAHRARGPAGPEAWGRFRLATDDSQFRLNDSGALVTPLEQTGVLVVVTLPLSDGGLRRSRLRSAYSRVRGVQAEVAAVRDAAAREIAAAYAALRTALAAHRKSHRWASVGPTVGGRTIRWLQPARCRASWFNPTFDLRCLPAHWLSPNRRPRSRAISSKGGTRTVSDVSSGPSAVKTVR